MLNPPDLQSQLEPRKFGGGSEWGTDCTASGWVSFGSYLAGALLKPLHRKHGDLESPREDFRAEFYKHYRKEAEEYDKEFMKKYEEDLDTTLIFVCCPAVYIVQARVLIRVAGWSVLRRHFRLHHPGQLRAPA